MATFNPSSLFGGALEHKHSEWAELANHDHVYVVQSVEKMSLLTGWDCDNHYKVIDETDKTLFNCAEDGSVAGKMLHGKDRDIKIHIIPKGGKKEILILQRPWTLTGQKAYMTDADGETGVRLGRLKRKGGLHNLSAHYEVHVQTVEKETQFYARALAVLPFKLTNFGLFDAEVCMRRDSDVVLSIVLFVSFEMSKAQSPPWRACSEGAAKFFSVFLCIPWFIVTITACQCYNNDGHRTMK